MEKSLKECDSLISLQELLFQLLNLLFFNCNSV
jgi:hypothetical protein